MSDITPLAEIKPPDIIPVDELSIAPVIITSIMFLIVQHSETTNQQRISDRITMLLSVYASSSKKLIRIMPRMADKLRNEYDELVNHISPKSVRRVKVVLCVFLAALALMHAIEATPWLDDWENLVQSLVPISLWMVVTMVVVVSSVMLVSSHDVAKYESKVDSLLDQLRIAQTINTTDDGRRQQT